MLTAGEAAAAAGEAAPVVCAVEPDGRAAWVGDRLDVHVLGRVAARSPVDEVVLLEMGEALGRLTPGPERRTPGGQYGCGFHFTVASRRGGGAAHRQLEIVVRVRGGAVHREILTLEIDSDAPAARLAGAAVAPRGAAVLAPPIHVNVEHAALAPDGSLTLSGWAISRNPLVTVQILSGERRLGVARLGDLRADVGRAHADFPNAGRGGFAFSGALQASDGAVRFLTVQAFALDGVSHEVRVAIPSTGRLAAAPRAPEDGPQRIHLHCDEATVSGEGRLQVTGWAVCSAGIGAVVVALDGEVIGEATLGQVREDVGRQFSDIPFARLSGFRFVAAEAAGIDLATARLRIYVLNGLGQRAEATVALAASVAPPPPPAAPPDTAAADAFRLELDTPRIEDGVAPEAVTTRLGIGGWALARAGVDRVAVAIDGRPAGLAHYGSPRPDVAAALADWPEALRSGYTFNCPPRLLKEGAHEAVVTVVARDGREHARRFAFTVRKPPDAEEQLGIRRRMTAAERNLQADTLRRLDGQPSFLVLLPVRAPDEADHLALTIASLQAQTCGGWQALVLAADSDCAAAAERATAGEGSAIRVLRSAKALERALGEIGAAALCTLLRPGDELGMDALTEVAIANALDRDTTLFYCDEVRISPASREREPFFKPDWSPNLLLATNYIGRFCCVGGTLLRQAGWTARELFETTDYAFALRCTEAASAAGGGIAHLPRLLCQRGPLDDDMAGEKAALAAAAARRGLPVVVAPGRAPGSHRLRRIAAVRGLVSVIIPTCAANGYIQGCIESLRASTPAGRVEIICIENIAEADAHWREWLQENADTVISTTEPFNWSRFNNICARQATGEFLLFLNDDIEITRMDWLDALLEPAALPGVGVVGPQLLYPNGTVQHAGMFLSRLGLARHAFRLADADDPAYFGLALTTRDVIAVTGACLLVRRALFERLGGFDEAHDVINNDLDFCLRVHRAGLAVVYTPHASLVHHEMASRGALPDDFDAARFGSQWAELFLRGDPFFNPNLSRNVDDYAPEEEPLQVVCAARPLFTHEEVRRIVAVKLDHIGDYFTALPALGRLRAAFPKARITLLGSPGFRELALSSGLIDAFEPFEFFHSRSGLGQVELAADDLAALRSRLAPARYDLAVDLRKHPDTREILRETGARFLAGFDHLGRFPWLDIALEWEGDHGMQAKRGHIGSDLMNLVAAIEAAASSEALPTPVAGPSDPGTLDFLPAPLRAFFERPVVCVHPGVGNVMRQWPLEKFAALIELITGGLGVHVAIIGGKDEEDIGEALLASASHPGAVRSFIGRVALADLPALLRACALFVGNNSGPQHIAASCGVPTIGIHSGVVDATEWAPLGPRAVALRRAMTCSPCYLARVQDCHRDLACLNGLEPAAVFALCERMLGRPRGETPAEPAC